MKWIESLRGKQPKTTEELRGAIEEAARLQAEAETAVTSLSARRAAALLDADDKEIDKLEAELARMHRQGDRATVALDELQRRLAELESAEAIAAEKEELARAEKAGQEAAALTAGEYIKASRALVAVLKKIRDLDAVIERTNSRKRQGLLPHHVNEPDVKAVCQRMTNLNPNMIPPPPVYASAYLPSPGVYGGIIDHGDALWSDSMAADEGR